MQGTGREQGCNRTRTQLRIAEQSGASQISCSAARLRCEETQGVSGFRRTCERHLSLTGREAADALGTSLRHFQRHLAEGCFDAHRKAPSGQAEKLAMEGVG
jgi:hypothetical protein